mmetsp:Transcript_13070/g.41052  ORF Transcript_13070/g.41052 Transcript_13070/m.41052 type:complete len:345 (+) Transcript_13070:570-1604(+)
MGRTAPVPEPAAPESSPQTRAKGVQALARSCSLVGPSATRAPPPSSAPRPASASLLTAGSGPGKPPEALVSSSAARAPPAARRTVRAHRPPKDSRRQCRSSAAAMAERRKSSSWALVPTPQHGRDSATHFWASSTLSVNLHSWQVPTWNAETMKWLYGSRRWWTRTTCRRSSPAASIRLPPCATSAHAGLALPWRRAASAGGADAKHVRPASDAMRASLRPRHAVPAKASSMAPGLSTAACALAGICRRKWSSCPCRCAWPSTSTAGATGPRWLVSRHSRATSPSPCEGLDPAVTASAMRTTNSGGTSTSSATSMSSRPGSAHSSACTRRCLTGPWPGSSTRKG